MNQNALEIFNNKAPLATLLHGNDLSEAEKFVNSFLQDKSDDVIVFEKPKVDELKNITPWINLRPSKEFKVIHVKSVNLISKEALNYLLKAVEDSPAYLKWFFYADSKHLNKALLSRCYCIPVTKEKSLVTVNGFDQVKNHNDAYLWFLSKKEELSDAELKESLVACCDLLLQKQTSFDKIHLVQRCKNLIKKESAGYENTFKSLLTQVF